MLFPSTFETMAYELFLAVNNLATHETMTPKLRRCDGVRVVPGYVRDDGVQVVPGRERDNGVRDDGVLVAPGTVWHDVLCDMTHLWHGGHIACCTRN